MRFKLAPTRPLGPARLFFLDFLAAFVVFAAVAGAFSIPQGNAFPAPPPLELTTGMVPAPAALVAPLQVVAPALPHQEGPSPLYTLSLLALAFSSLTAFNLALWRHLRTAYALPRRRF